MDEIEKPRRMTFDEMAKRAQYEWQRAEGAEAVAASLETKHISILVQQQSGFVDLRLDLAQAAQIHATLAECLRAERAARIVEALTVSPVRNQPEKWPDYLRSREHGDKLLAKRADEIRAMKGGA